MVLASPTRGSRILRQEPLELDRAYYPMLVVNGEVSCRAQNCVDRMLAPFLL